MVKVISTFGPSMYDERMLKRVCAESDVMRLNISHQRAREAAESIARLDRYGKPVMVDTSGPEVRVRTSEKLVLRKGDTITFGTSGNSRFRFDQDLYSHLKKGDRIYLEDGLICLHMASKGNGKMQFKAMDEVMVRDNMGVNLKGRSFMFPILKKNDIEILHASEPAFVALSYTRNADDIRQARKHTSAKIIVKIENPEGVKNIHEILEEADGVMVARGDLGVEVPAEEVPIIQKQIIEHANNYAKPSIVATQVLYSMVSNPSPTRAEVSDIANAVLDGADAIMLSNETAVGKHPLSAIREIRRTGGRIAPYVRTKVSMEGSPKTIEPVSDVLSKTIYTIASRRQIDKIVAVTRTGYSVRLISRFKLGKPIIAIATDGRVAQEMNLFYNVKPVLWSRLPKHKFTQSIALRCLEEGLVNEDDTVVFAAAVKTKETGLMNMIEVHTISKMLDFIDF